MKKIISSLAILALSLGVFAAKPLSTRAEDNGCGLEEGLAALRELQDHPLSDSNEAVNAELAARKNILNTLLDCASEEASTLKNSVAALPADTKDAKNLQQSFLSKFDETLGYYNLQKSRVGDLGLEGTKEFSRNLKEWRNVAYAPLSQQAANFIIWTKNQTILSNAQSRFEQISRTLGLLKLTDDPNIADLLKQAGDNLRAANGANDNAKDALRRFAAPDDSSIEIKNTLNSLALAYQAFFDIAAALEKK